MSISKTRISGLAVASGMVLAGAVALAVVFTWPPTVTDPVMVSVETGGIPIKQDLQPIGVATDGAGHWVAVWQAAFSVLVSRSEDNGRTWTTPGDLDTLPGLHYPSDQLWDGAPDVATDGSGNWVAVWDSTDSLGGTIGADGDILVARSTDNGAT